MTEIQHLKQMLADANEEKDIQVLRLLGLLQVFPSLPNRLPSFAMKSRRRSKKFKRCFARKTRPRPQRSIDCFSVHEGCMHDSGQVLLREARQKIESEALT